MGKGCSKQRYQKIPATERPTSARFDRIDSNEHHLDYLNVHRIHFKTVRFADNRKCCDNCCGTTAVMSWEYYDEILTFGQESGQKRRLCMNCIYDAIVQ